MDERDAVNEERMRRKAAAPKVRTLGPFISSSDAHCRPWTCDMFVCSVSKRSGLGQNCVCCKQVHLADQSNQTVFHSAGIHSICLHDVFHPHLIWVGFLNI